MSLAITRVSCIHHSIPDFLEWKSLRKTFHYFCVEANICLSSGIIIPWVSSCKHSRSRTLYCSCQVHFFPGKGEREGEEGREDREEGREVGSREEVRYLVTLV